MSAFVLKVFNQDGIQLKDTSSFWKHDSFQLTTLAGIVDVATAVDTNVEEDAFGKQRIVRGKTVMRLSVSVPKQCCKNPHTDFDYDSDRCINCLTPFSYLGGFEVVKAGTLQSGNFYRGHWVEDKEFLDYVSPMLARDDTLTAILWAKDLYEYLRSNFAVT